MPRGSMFAEWIAGHAELVMARSGVAQSAKLRFRFGTVISHFSIYAMLE
jgi:hypothetical protein